MNEEYKNFLQGARKKPITTHFTMFDICNSSTAIAKNIDNRPTTQIVVNATALIKNVLEPIRNHFNSPVIVNCMYRSPLLNKAVGGVATSQHVKGQAADITVQNHTVQEVFDYIKNNLIFDQLIHEGTWVHGSFSLVHNRKESLKLVNGKYIQA